MGKNKVQLKCKRCEYEWNYTGESSYFTSCPRCRNSNVNVKTHRVKRQKQGVKIAEPFATVGTNQQTNKPAI